jgi:cell wall-associated NlpC family hydrolase
VGRRNRWRTWRWRFVPIALVIVSVVPFAAADAQGIGDLRAQAAQIQTEMASLRDEIEVHAEELNRARARSDADRAEVERANAELDTARAEFDQRRRQLADYAVQAYMVGGDLPAVDGLLGGDPDDTSRRISYLKTASGDRRSLLDRLEVTQQDLDAKLQRVRLAGASAEADAKLADESRQAAEQAEADLNELLGRVQGELGELVRQEDERRSAEAAQQAAAAAEAARQQAEAESTSQGIASYSADASSEASSAASTSTPRATFSTAGASAVAATALQAAFSQLGVPYVYGGASPDEGFDCSGLVQWAYAQVGRGLSHAADWQRDETQPISESELQPGDLVFYGDPPSHDAIYAGGGQIINAPYTGEVVRVQDMYYSSKPMTFGRVN